MKKLGRKLTCVLMLSFGMLLLSAVHGARGNAATVQVIGGKISGGYKVMACSHPVHETVYVPPTCEAKGYTLEFCVSCNKELGRYDYDDKLGHEWKAATCAKPQQCSRCGNVTGQPNKMNHTSIVGPTCEEPKRCTTCNTEFPDAPALGHSYNAATCTKPETCSRCNGTKGKKLGHEYADATCTAPKTCTRYGCKATDGKALGHDYTEATCYTKATCKKCGFTTGDYAHVAKKRATCQEKAICSKCGQTYGDYGSHVYDPQELIPSISRIGVLGVVKAYKPCCSMECLVKGCNYVRPPLIPHNYTRSGTVPPSYDKPGYHYMACSMCGAKLITETIPAVGNCTVTFQYDGKTTTTSVPCGGTFTIPADIDPYEKDRNRLYWIDELSSDGTQYIVGQAIPVERNMSLVPVYEEIYRQIGTVKNPADGVYYNIWLIDEMSPANEEAFYWEFLKKHPGENNIAVLLVKGQKCYRIKNSWNFCNKTFLNDVCEVIITYNQTILNTACWDRTALTCKDEWLEHNVLYLLSTEEYNALIPIVSKILHSYSPSEGSDFDNRVNNWHNRSVDVDLDNIADGYLPATTLNKIIEIINELAPYTIIVV